MTNANKPNRRQQILESLALMLESSPGSRITTAKLAKQVGVSEAALYRHFPSKSKMFEGLIDFVEEVIFSRVSMITKDASSAKLQCERILLLLLNFTERNPGITRILNGDALTGENDKLRMRVGQLYERLETQLKQIIREAEAREGLRTTISAQQSANMMLALAEGRIGQFVRTEFKRKPTADWADQWQQLIAGLFMTREEALKNW